MDDTKKNTEHSSDSAEQKSSENGDHKSFSSQFPSRLTSVRLLWLAGWAMVLTKNLDTLGSGNAYSRSVFYHYPYRSLKS